MYLPLESQEESKVGDEGRDGAGLAPPAEHWECTAQ